MKPSRHDALRAKLRACEDGLTVKQLSVAANLPADSVRQALHQMADAYIDRWINFQVAVWCVAHVPDNCPKPKKFINIPTKG